MPVEFRLPDIGEGLTDAEIIEWHVSVDDDVTVDQLIVEVETAKTTVEITSTHDGTILALAGAPGDTIDVGAVLFVIGDSAESVPLDREDPKRSLRPSPFEGGQQRSARDDVGGLQARDERSGRSAIRGSSQQHPPGSEGTPTSDYERTRTRPRAMPIVRKLAKDTGADLDAIEGSGPGGVITRADVENAVATVVRDDLVPLSRVRRAIARAMTESWTTIPHVTVQADVRAESLMAARRQRSFKPFPVEALVGMAVLPLLKQYREFNAAISGDAADYKTVFNLGYAVDTDEGLLVVVVRDADQLSVHDLATEFERLAAAALDGTLKPTEATGQTFTISNIGALGGGHGTPIIPVGTSAIVSIGRALDQPVVEQGELAVGRMAPIDLSYDHRLIDGSLGQRFLSDLVANLESIQSVLAYV